MSYRCHIKELYLGCVRPKIGVDVMQVGLL